MARKSWWNDRYFPPSRPIAAKGGIKSRSSRGEFGTSWWAKRWIAVLEGFHIGARLTRGRSYARGGQVLEIAIEEGKVKAKVQGSRPRPYDITIAVKTLTGPEWAKVIEALGSQALFTASLMAGEMPRDIEPLFAGVGLSLFPARHADLKTDCTCPDSSNPCKHIAAAYYLLGEEFDRDPFLIFTLRGLGRDALLAKLGATAPASDVVTPAAAPRPPEPLIADAAAFWGGAVTPDDAPAAAVEVPKSPAAQPRRLGSFPFWRGESPFLETLAPLYAAASPRGLEVLLGPEKPADRTQVDA